ncbi:4-hydroxyphenylpyruvate dioxygenase [Micromonospora echinofusca]|uniref:4-hydroxyphenylpyruvate dioxygenase n=1 Tax=Micromonospora echinofusca TaxID=47858 RepID=A0ABS3VTG5_MICEH|nr:4-hydroxyphenylpyruvate dioxygenase [Micromonospora echinofusca]MBO4207816.1 4-hydroxyphenylpyruvate dioxygenase [Micromonospora echinofusca]
MDPVGIDHVALLTDRLDHVVEYFRDAMGFAAHPPVTSDDGTEQHTSVLLTQGRIRVVATAPTAGRGRVSDYVARHADGVADIAMGVEDAAAAFDTAVRRGARAVAAPAETRLADGARAVTATVSGPGDLAHTFVQRLDGTAGVDDGLLKTIDHIAICLPGGRLVPTTEFYVEVFGFRTIFEELVEVGDQAIDSKVVQNNAGDITFTLIEPDVTRSPGQIDRFLTDHRGAGVQHLAFLTDDITVAVPRLSGQGVTFLQAPQSYYTMLAGRAPELTGEIDTLRAVDVLVDRDHWGHLLQIFTQSPHTRGTLFYELIERRNARTFGSGNVRALYEAVEHDRVTSTVPQRS